MKKYILLIFSILCSFCSFSQKDSLTSENLKLDNAEYLFAEKNYLLALPTYLYFEETYPDDAYIKHRIGVCYLHKPDEVEKSVPYIENAFALDSTLKDILFDLGRSYAATYKFAEAIEKYDQYLLQKLSAERVDEVMKYRQYAQNGIVLISNISDSKVTNIGEPVNTTFSEYVPLITNDASILIFTYRGEKSKGGLQNKSNKPDPDGFYYEDIFISHRSGENWLSPKGIGDNINTSKHDAAIALSGDGQKLFIYKSSKKDKGDIYISHLKGDDWSAPEKLGKNINTKFWEGSCSLTSDENTLYFTSERPGGFGGRDIYISKKMPDGNWGPAKNLGPTINTPYNDDAPFIHPDGITLFFSSQGHNSMGGYDIFVTRNTDNTWSVPENLGYPINTSGDDIYYVISASGEDGYYSSSKAGGFGQQDIYHVSPAYFGTKPILALVLGVITADGNPVEASIDVSDMETNEKIATYNSNATTGKYILSLAPGKNYKIAFEIEGYQPHIEYIDVKSLDSYVQVAKDFKLVKTEEEKEAISEEKGLQAIVNEKLEQQRQDEKKFYIELPSKTDEDILTEINAKYERNPSGKLIVGPYKSIKAAEQDRQIIARSDTSLLYSQILTKEIVQSNAEAEKEEPPFVKSLELSEKAKKDVTTERKGETVNVEVKNNNVSYNQLVLDYGEVIYDDLTFRVEIGEVMPGEDFEFQHLEKYGILESKKYDDGRVRYSIGPFKTLIEAEELRQRIIENEPELNDVLVTVFHFGKRKTVEEFFNEKPCDPVIAYDIIKQFIGKDLKDVNVYNDFISKCGNYNCGNLIFKVQIGAYRKPKNFKYPKLEEFGSAEIELYPDGITRFTMKQFTNLKEAEQFRQKVIAKGTKDAWITAFIDGERKLLQEMIENNFYRKVEL